MAPLPIIDLARDQQDAMRTWRRDFHAHPELGFKEIRTSRVIADELRRLGLEVSTGAAKTGVVATIGEGPRAIGIRADMDALPIPEANDVPYASTSPGIMHACGHDAHSAILLGVARILASVEKDLPGQVRLLFQPCEETNDSEGKSGGQRMVEEGVLDGLDHVIALHVDSELQAGRISIAGGYITANVDNFFAKIVGRGSHGAHPDQGVDPVFLLGQLIVAMQSVVSRRVEPIRPAVVTIGRVTAGLPGGENVIPAYAELSGTLRSYDDATREKLIAEVEKVLSITRSLGGDYELNVVRGCPSTYNSPEVAAVIRQTAEDLYGADALEPFEQSLGGEDFSYMTQAAPGAMFMLGAKKDAVSRPHHNPLFDIDEDIFSVGAAMLAETAVRLLERPLTER
jgi:amidohydrolase